jgi:hypothetical protein
MKPTNDRSGSTSAVSGFLRHGCFTPETGHRSARLARQKSAISDQMHRSKWHPYSITSSASASNLSGISRPSAFAVLRLITNSNFVDCWTGRSAGFSPLRMPLA